MIRAAVFDLDDTLYLERDYMKSGFAHLSRKLSQKYGVDSRLAFERMCALSDAGEKTFDGVLSSFGIPYDSDGIASMAREYRSHAPEISFCPDTLPALRILRKMGLKLGVVTGGHAESQRKKLASLGAQEIFDHLLLTDGIGAERQKPSPAPFLKMAELLGIPIKEMLCVGDNPEKDFYVGAVTAAVTVRIIREGGLYASGGYYGAVREQYRISSLLELPEIIAGINR